MSTLNPADIRPLDDLRDEPLASYGEVGQIDTRREPIAREPEKMLDRDDQVRAFHWRRRMQMVRRFAYGLGVFGVVLAGILVWRSGWLEQIAEETSLRLAGAVQNDTLLLGRVTLEGRLFTDEEDILNALGFEHGLPIMEIDLAAARARVEELGWVKSASITRILPDRLHLTLTERVAFALWQQQGELYVIDAEGAVLTGRAIERFAHLPLVVGEGAPRMAAEMLGLIDTEPQLAPRVRALIRVGDRRWNVRFDNGVDVRLPEQGASGAWNRLARLDAENGLLDRDIELVDLRLPGQLIVKQSAAAADKRAQSDEAI